MLATIVSGTVVGVEGVLVEVEVDVAGRGFPTLTIVGLPNKAIDEAKERVRTAIVNSSCEMPDSRITVNLAPADMPKAGSGFDLPIAVGILAASGVLEKSGWENALFVGELSLEGHLRKTPGILSIIACAKQKGILRAFVPQMNAAEAALVPGIDIYPLESLTAFILHTTRHVEIQKQKPTPIIIEKRNGIQFDFSEIRGQRQAKRALQIAAAGFHNIFLKGPPGAGKTMLSRAFISILPPLSVPEIIEVSQIYSIAGLLGEKSYIAARPFRSPHHTTSRVGLIGGGTEPAPGEISLAHRGVLFLDEFPEFPRFILESLRQPLEDGVISISRAAGNVLFRCRFILVAAANPCPCGYVGSSQKKCVCTAPAIVKYQKRLSGPLLDRIDMHVIVPSVEEVKLVGKSEEVPSELFQNEVLEATERQRYRLRDAAVKTNGEMSLQHVRKHCAITSEADQLLKQAVSRFGLSARSFVKILKLGQTIADLSKTSEITDHHIAEALQYRAMERYM